jgi:mono/diheme cytochrome c family protein
VKPEALALAVVLAIAAAAPLTAQHAPADTTVRGLPTNEEGQPPRLPPLPAGLTLDAIRAGDSLFHGKGHCFVCHGADATGLPDAGSALTMGLNFVPTEWAPIDSLIAVGIPEAVARSGIGMPPRGGKSDLAPDEIRAIAAYVWAISQTRGEPWPGGHATHAASAPPGSTTGTAAPPRAAVARRDS